MNSVQNIFTHSDDDFLEEGTLNDPAIILCSQNTSSSHVSAFLSDEPITSSINNNYAMDFIQTDCDAEDSVSQMLSTNVLTPTRIAQIFSDCIDSSLSESNQESDI